MESKGKESVNSSKLVLEAIKAIGDQFKGSLFKLAKYGLGMNDINHRTHGKIIDLLESDAKRKLICVPRGCLKSSIACVAFPIWKLINRPDIRIMIDSEIYTNSCTFIREVRGHLESRMFTILFGEFKSKTWNEGELIIKQRKKVLKEPSLSAGGIGTRKIGQHFDLMIHDDMNSPENTSTPEMAAKVIDHYKLNTSILEPDGTLVVVGTRYAANDLIGHILTNEAKVDYKSILNLNG